jgi:hypothetical protein
MRHLVMNGAFRLTRLTNRPVGSISPTVCGWANFAPAATAASSSQHLDVLGQVTIRAHKKRSGEVSNNFHRIQCRMHVNGDPCRFSCDRLLIGCRNQLGMISLHQYHQNQNHRRSSVVIYLNCETKESQRLQSEQIMTAPRLIHVLTTVQGR